MPSLGEKDSSIFKSPCSRLIVCQPSVITKLAEGLNEDDMLFCKWALADGGVQVSYYFLGKYYSMCRKCSLLPRLGILMVD